MGLRKALPVLTLGLLAALAAGGCGVADPAAASVNDVKIDRGDFEEELKALRDNPELQKSGGTGLTGSGMQTINARISTGWLTANMYDALVSEELKKRKITPSPADIAAGRDQLKAQFGEAKVAEAFPKWFRDRVVARSARLIALRGALSGYDLTDAGLQKYFNEHKTDFDEICPSHMLLESKAAAAAAVARLKAGESFAALAKELSGDQGTAGQGGDLGCTTKGRLVREFEDAAFAATVGVPTDPVETQFGWHIILVNKKNSRPFADVKDEVIAQVDQEGRLAFEKFLPKAIRDADVSVDPRFGSFRALNDDSGSLPSVVAPTSPSPPEKRPGKTKGSTTTSTAPTQTAETPTGG